jgi:DNA primase
MSMPGYPYDFQALKAAVSIERFLDTRDAASGLRRQGGRLVGCCPIHKGDNPNAFVVDLDKNLWHCFTQCAAGGDVVELVRRLDGVEYREAAEILARLAGRGLGSERLCHARSATFHRFTRTLALDADVPFLLNKGILPQTARRFEVGAWHGAGFLEGCVGVRLHDVEGCPLGYAGRRLNLQSDALNIAKWRFPPGLAKREILYGFPRVGPFGGGDVVVVVECPWGAMRLSQVGVPSVALLGTTLFPAQQALLAAAGRVVLLLDGDPAGRAAAQRIREQLRTSTEVELINLPSGLDPDDLSDSEISTLVGRFLD